MKSAFIRLGLLLLGTAALSLALAPMNQFYLAWVGLVPFFLVMRDARSGWRAFAWGWLGGWMFFIVNMWWLWFVSPAGLFALTIYLALFWGFAAVVIRALMNEQAPTRPRSSVLTLVLLATTWVGFEWMRGNVSFLGRQGLPWLYLGQTQSPLLAMCQIADVLGITGVTWWVVLLNAAIAISILHRKEIRRGVPAIVTTTVIVLAFAVYGAFRLSQNTTTPGPTVIVVQANYKQSNTGEKGASSDEIVAFHLRATRDAIEKARADGKKIDLVVWSETMLPAINTEARRAAHGTDAGDKWNDIVYQLGSLAQENQVHLLVGGIYFADWQARDEQLVPMDRRNSAYFFDTSGALTDTRYDKIHLVPFGEYIPFKHSIPPLYRLFLKLGPNYYEEYVLTPGDKLVTFGLADGTRFVVPICFEDVVPEQVAAMFHGDAGTKRADFIVNITNDGWFRGAQMPQHLQAAIFRSIENRAPTARSVNTGISGFVDSVGHVSGTVPAQTEGTSVATLMLDRRVSLYTRVGDVFALTCVGATLGVAGWMFSRHMRYKRDLQKGS